MKQKAEMSPEVRLTKCPGATKRSSEANIRRPRSSVPRLLNEGSSHQMGDGLSESGRE